MHIGPVYEQGPKAFAMQMNTVSRLAKWGMDSINYSYDMNATPWTIAMNRSARTPHSIEPKYTVNSNVYGVKSYSYDMNTIPKTSKDVHFANLKKGPGCTTHKIELNLNRE
jgi:hypothetical protein